MRDQRLDKAAKNILGYSLHIQPGEKILMEGPASAKPMLRALISQAYGMGAFPFARLRDEEIMRWMLQDSTEERMQAEAKWELQIAGDIDAYLQIDTQENDAEFSAVSAEKMQMRARVRRPWVDLITNRKKWVLMNWPTKAQAQKAKMPYDEFCDFVIDCSSVDYSEMAKRMEPLSKLFSKTDRVNIKGPGTDLSFSIKGIPNVICAGENNIPDGELYTAPVKDSVEGTLAYNTPCPYYGKVFNGVRLEFKKGRIVRATAANDTDSLNSIFDTDAGARYVGEFSLGLNPQIKRAFGNILFDEKISGSFHFTPGSAYENSADNGNRSNIHWDMVCIQTPEMGGGEIWFDGVLVRKDGRFVLPELLPLNPENY
jgi:aminopeptidase